MPRAPGSTMTSAPACPDPAGSRLDLAALARRTRLVVWLMLGPGLALPVHGAEPGWSAAESTALLPVSPVSLRERWLERKNASGTPTASPAGRIDKPGDYSFALEWGGQTRRYRVHVPASYVPTVPTAMVLTFHGGGGNMDYQADDQYYGFITKSEQAGYIVVFPNGTSPLASGKLATWNAGNCCGGARDKNSDDVGFVREMIKRLKGQLNIDPDRVYASGMSNGAMFSHRLACEMADTIRAIAAVAGADGTLECKPSRPVSVLAIHARDDEMVLFNGGAGRDTKIAADFVSVPETVSRWVRRNQCEPTPRRVLDKPGVYCDAYTACREGAEVKLCVTETGGHSWPGGVKVRTKEPGSTALSATDAMWEFFRRH